MTMQRSEAHRHGRHGMRGVSLIELMIGLFVFSIGALAVLQMVLGAFRVNDHSRNIDGATNAARVKMEELLQVTYNSSTLQAIQLDPDNHPLSDRTGDAVPGLGAADESASDHGEEIDRYRVFWNLAHDRPVNNTLTIAVIATWDDSLGAGRRVVYQTVRVKE